MDVPDVQMIMVDDLDRWGENPLFLTLSHSALLTISTGLLWASSRKLSETEDYVSAVSSCRITYPYRLSSSGKSSKESWQWSNSTAHL